jgi:AraC-like DNA-binding protein
LAANEAVERTVCEVRASPFDGFFLNFGSSVAGYVMNLSSNGPKTAPATVLAIAGQGAAPFFALRPFFAGLFDLAAPERKGEKSRPDFFAHATSQFILSDINTPSLQLSRTATASTRDSLQGFGLRLQFSGEARGRAGDRDFELGAGDLLFVDLQQSLDFSILAGPEGARDITLWVSRGKMLAAFGRDDILHGLVLSGGAPAGAMIGGGLKILAEQAKNLSVQAMDALCDGLVALCARALAPVLAAPRPGAMSPAAAFVTIRRYIDRNLRAPDLDAQKLADIFGVSRASLYRLFEPVGGVASYIRKARLNRAYQDIMDSESSGRRVGSIAFALGFQNVSAFNRAFRDHYGVSPREARARALAPAPAPGAQGEAPVETASLAYWLARIGSAAPAPPDGPHRIGANSRATGAATRSAAG